MAAYTIYGGVPGFELSLIRVVQCIERLILVNVQYIFNESDSSETKIIHKQNYYELI